MKKTKKGKYYVSYGYFWSWDGEGVYGLCCLRPGRIDLAFSRNLSVRLTRKMNLHELMRRGETGVRRKSQGLPRDETRFSSQPNQALFDTEVKSKVIQSFKWGEIRVNNDH